jgi:hypothetical protein
MRQITPSLVFPLQAALKATRAGNGSAQPRAAAFDDRDIPDRRLFAGVVGSRIPLELECGIT